MSFTTHKVKLPSFAVRAITHDYVTLHKDEIQSTMTDPAFFSRLTNFEKTTTLLEISIVCNDSDKKLFINKEYIGDIKSTIQRNYADILMTSKVTQVCQDKPVYIIQTSHDDKTARFLHYADDTYTVISTGLALSCAGYCCYYWTGQQLVDYYGFPFAEYEHNKIYRVRINRLTPRNLSINNKAVLQSPLCTIPSFDPESESCTIGGITGENVRKCISEVSGIVNQLYYSLRFQQHTVEVLDCKNKIIYTTKNLINEQISNILVEAQKYSTLTTNVFLTGNASGTTATINFGSTATTTAEPCSWDTITTNSTSNNPLVFSPSYTPMTTNSEVPYNSFTTNKDTIFTSTMENEKENKNMFKFDFGTCENMNLRMSPYGLAVKKSDGWVSYDSKSETIIDVDIFAFDCGKYIMRMPVPVSSVAEGDMIMHNGSPVYVTAVSKKSFEVIDPLHGEEKTIKATMSPFGFNFITKVIPLFNAFNSTEASDENPFGNMLPFMLMSQDGGNIDPMVMAMMFMNGNGAASDNNMMKFLPFALMSQNGNNKSDYLPYIMMMGMNNIG